MHQDRLNWIVGALVSLGLAVASIMLGRGLMPSFTEMQGKLGTTAPLVIAWFMIGTTAIVGVVLAVVLFATGLGSAAQSEAHGSRH
jgi:hypothetical protein